MSSRGRRLLAVLVATLALAGCGGLPPGVDGNLTNNWSAMPLPKVAVPVAGVCYPGRYVHVWVGDFTTVDCANMHQVETVFVGTFTGADAQRSAAPATDSPALPAVYTQCQKGADDYLGGDWHTADVWLGLVVPSNAAWQAGARWFRCDMIHRSDPFATSIVDHGSLRGDLAGARSAAYGCLSTTEDKDRTITAAKPVDCAMPHQAEFAGVYTAPDVPYPSDGTTRDTMLERGCQGVVATFLGLQNVSQWTSSAVGWWGLGWDQDQWKLGDRGTQCFAYAYTKSGKFVGSVKGIRNQAPKG